MFVVDVTFKNRVQRTTVDISEKTVIIILSTLANSFAIVFNSCLDAQNRDGMNLFLYRYAYHKRAALHNFDHVISLWPSLKKECYSKYKCRKHVKLPFDTPKGKGQNRSSFISLVRVLILYASKLEYVDSFSWEWKHFCFVKWTKRSCTFVRTELDLFKRAIYGKHVNVPGIVAFCLLKDPFFFVLKATS